MESRSTSPSQRWSSDPLTFTVMQLRSAHIHRNAAQIRSHSQWWSSDPLFSQWWSSDPLFSQWWSSDPLKFTVMELRSAHIHSNAAHIHFIFTLKEHSCPTEQVFSPHVLRSEVEVKASGSPHALNCDWG